MRLLRAALPQHPQPRPLLRPRLPELPKDLTWSGKTRLALQAQGQGAAMKVVNQLLCGVHIAVAAEGLALAERAGIDPKARPETLAPADFARLAALES